MSAGSLADARAGGPAAARLATVADLDEVVRLAGVMYRVLGAGPPVIDDERWSGWQAGAAEALRCRLGRGTAVFVVDRPGGGLAACGAGSITTRLPSPWLPDARVGYIQWMSTDVGCRRRGHGRAVLRALLGWFASQGVDTVELHATPAGEALYRSEGFWGGSTGKAMRRRSWDPPPPEGGA